MMNLKHKDLWTTYVDISLNAIKQGHYLRATQMLRSALVDADDFSELDSRLVWLAHSLAERCCAQGECVEAERLYSLILEAREKILGPDHPDVVDSLEKIAWVLNYPLMTPTGLKRATRRASPAECTASMTASIGL
ncbi:MAG: tetratricopeptide repeat protein [Candidatus Melainabacteria bacterium]|nr:tetratricopeptide repeat protein [Candidatus Melainabacteria bacterium]